MIKEKEKIKKDIISTTMNYLSNLTKIFYVGLLLEKIIVKDIFKKIKEDAKKEWKKDKFNTESNKASMEVWKEMSSGKKELEPLKKKLISASKKGYLLFKYSILWNKEKEVKAFPYNLLLISLISSFEVFVKDIFIILINRDEEIKNKILNSKKKISFEILKRYNQKEISLGEIIAENYNFQNINSIKDAYTFIGQEKLIQDAKPILDKINKEIIKRHKIMHESQIYPKINQKYLDKIQNEFASIGIYFSNHLK